MDDVWKEEPEDELKKDTEVHLDHLFQDGFRKGVAAGQEEQVQAGFDTGYAEGAKEGFSWGTCHGILEMYKALKTKVDDPTVMQKLDSAAEKLQGIEEKDAFISSYNTCVDNKIAQTPDTTEPSLLPEKLKSDNDVTENIQAVKGLLKDGIP